MTIGIFLLQAQVKKMFKADFDTFEHVVKKYCLP